LLAESAAPQLIDSAVANRARKPEQAFRGFRSGQAAVACRKRPRELFGDFAIAHETQRELKP